MLFELARVWLKIFLRGSPEMPKKKYIVNLYDAEREQLQLLLRSGKHSTRKVTRARILLKAADGRTDKLIAAACSDAPEGRTHWTMQLLADRPVELKVVETISDETVRRTLKKTSSSHG